MAYKDWERIDVNPLDVVLDPQNYRLNLGDSPTQGEIIKYMLANEDLKKLTEHLASLGYYLGEAITIVEEGGKFVVIEGNRRVTACKILLDNTLAPSRKGQPKSTKAIQEALKLIPAVIAPSRIAAAVYIVDKHVSGGAKRWSPESKLRAVMSLFNDGMPVHEIADQLKLKKGEVAEQIRDDRLIKYVKNLPGWTEEEKKKFSKKTNALTRFFRIYTKNHSKRVKATDILRLTYSGKEYNIQTEIDQQEFERYMAGIGRVFLLPSKFDTRSTVEDVFAYIGHPDFIKTKDDNEFIPTDSRQIIEQKDLNPLEQPEPVAKTSKTQPKSTPTLKLDFSESTSEAVEPKLALLSTIEQETLESKPIAKGRPHSPKPFLRGLRCTVSDDHLAMLIKEANNIDYNAFPIASAALTRTLIHQALLYRFDKMGKKHLIQQDEGFKNVVSKAITHSHQLVEPSKKLSFETILERFRDDKWKDYLDKIVHPNSLVRPSGMVVAEIGELCRGILEYILDKTTYNLPPQN